MELKTSASDSTASATRAWEWPRMPATNLPAASTVLTARPRKVAHRLRVRRLFCTAEIRPTRRQNEAGNMRRHACALRSHRQMRRRGGSSSDAPMPGRAIGGSDKLWALLRPQKLHRAGGAQRQVIARPQNLGLDTDRCPVGRKERGVGLQLVVEGIEEVQQTRVISGFEQRRGKLLAATALTP